MYGPLPGEPATGWLERNYLRAFQRCYQALGALLDPALLREAGGDDAMIGLLEPFFRAAQPRDFVNKLMAMNIRLKGANLILVKVEKMTAANGVLALPPLFSRRIIETSMICPSGTKLEGAVEKSVLKKAVRDAVPDAIIARPKSGMMVPVRFWFCLLYTSSPDGPNSLAGPESAPERSKHRARAPPKSEGDGLAVPGVCS